MTKVTLTEEQKMSLRTMVNRFLFHSEAVGITDPDRLEEIMRDTLPTNTDQMRVALNYAIRFMRSPEAHPELAIGGLHE